MSHDNWSSLGVVLGAVLGLVGLAEISADTKQEKSTTAANHLHEDVKLPTQGIARLLPTKDSKVHGMLWLTQTKEGLAIQGEVQGLKPGLHGFHIHEFGDLSDPEGKSAGGHFNPTETDHGAPDAEHHHAGDLGNIKADAKGVAKVDLKVNGLKLHFVIGRSFVVHAGADDLKSQPSGDSGDRAAVGVIGLAQTKPANKK